ncbi:carbohydrate ABC transporter permease [Anaerocolumna sp. MB42-C2]|uniref:carbohydrate ABC transporter permease n=1 Tax=Anaerocolumna sp. MB42-C2 TaxID=3070997 RepID=UPI0027E055B3|nr:carbohydrate ABC transporter permease [Anaerocolumna sp. MB42-C2]WMJ87366.1 carbohydrate ABC transporter permease [Anaerocolumna sp. MB42-C2]
MKHNKNIGETVFVVICYGIVIFVCIVTLYPFLYLLSASISSSTSVMKNEVVLLPKEFTLRAYQVVVQYKGIWSAYLNTIYYTVFGTILSLGLTILAAYPLSKMRWAPKRIMGLFVVFTLWFTSGMIPFFLVMHELKLTDSRLGILLYPAINALYIIILRTHFQGLPMSLEESAKLEGANDWQILKKIIVPLSKPVLAAIGLYYAIARWNSFFWESILLTDDKRVPVQVLLRRIIISSQLGQDMAAALSRGEASVPVTIKFATIIITTLPIIVLYPFFQKYFVSGALVGGIKE